MRAFDGIRSDLDANGSMAAMDRYGQQAVEMIAGRRAHAAAFDLAREPAAMRDRYGPHLWCQQALIARRLVEAGVSFVTIDLSYHTASGTWDNHGDNVLYGGIWNGLRPLLPLFDHLVTTLVGDLDQRGMLDDVMVIAMGEFGRTPMTGTQGSTDGRDHWPVVMSMALAGGGLRHGQVIGARPKPTAVPSSNGPLRRAIWPRRSIRTWACRSIRTISIRRDGRGRLSTTASVLGELI